MLDDSYIEQSPILFFMGPLIAREIEKVQLKFLFCRFSNPKFSKATDSNSCNKVSVEIFLSILGFFVKVICCMFDRSFLRFMDGNNRSANAPLVQSLIPSPIKSGTGLFLKELREPFSTN